MARRCYYLIIFILTLLVPSTGSAYSKRDPIMTVFTLEHYCTELLKSSYSIDYNQQYVENVTGFITGFYDTANVFLSPHSPDFCAPVDISIKDTCTIFNAWLVRHINDDDVMFAAPSLTAALKEVYPCRE